MFKVAPWLLCLGLLGCDAASKACNDESLPAKTRVSACGERCEKDQGDACVTQDAIAQKACFENGDVEICRWMCEYATVGKDVYCKEHEKLSAKAP
jgi:hypothetical protein